jgi:hypothetical protein
LHYFSKFKGPFRGLANIFGVKFLTLSILKNRLVEIEALRPNLHVSAIKSIIESCAGSPYHDHQICCLCLSATVSLSVVGQIGLVGEWVALTVVLLVPGANEREEWG